MEATHRGTEYSSTVTQTPLGPRSTEGLLVGLAVVPAFLTLLVAPMLVAGGTLGALAFVGFRKLQSVRETAAPPPGRQPSQSGPRYGTKA